MSCELLPTMTGSSIQLNMNNFCRSQSCSRGSILSHYAQRFVQWRNWLVLRTNLFWLVLGRRVNCSIYRQADKLFAELSTFKKHFGCLMYNSSLVSRFQKAHFTSFCRSVKVSFAADERLILKFSGFLVGANVSSSRCRLQFAWSFWLCTQLCFFQSFHRL